LGIFRRRRKPSAPRARVSTSHSVGVTHDALKAEVARVEQDLPEGHRDNLTAAGSLVRHGQATYLRRLIMPWQIRAFGYFDLVGEFKFAAQFYARALSQLELFAAERDENGDLVRTENEEVVAAFERIKDPGGIGRSGLQRAYGLLAFLVGEAILFVSIDPETNEEQWEMLSTDEIRLLDGNYTRFKAPVLPATLFRPAPDDAFVPVADKEGENQGPAGVGTAVAYRLHRPHPRFSALPDSTTEGVLDILEELVLLTQVIRARLRSRLWTAGFLFIDDRITTRPDEAVPDEDVLEDPLMEDLTEAITTAIADEGTAAAVAPILLRVRVPDGMKLADLVYHMQIQDPLQIYPEVGLRSEAIRRLAIALDMPVEALLGFTDTNHWNAWIIDDQIWQAHIQPVADGFVEDLTSAYLGPYLREELNMADWKKYVIAYDATKVINHPDRTKIAMELHGKAVIGDEALRRETAFSEDDKPTKEESARIVGIATRDPSLAWLGVPSVRSGGVEVAPGEISTSQDEHPGGPATGAEAETGAPAGGQAPGTDTTVGSLGTKVGSLGTTIEGAAVYAQLRAREAAGARLRQLARRDDEAMALIDGVTNGLVAPKLGRTKVRRLLGGAGEAELVAATHDIILAALRELGVRDAAAAESIAETIERHAARTLYDERPDPLPPTFGAKVEGLLAAAKNGR
jgi:hypothetical protein